MSSRASCGAPFAAPPSLSHLARALALFGRLRVRSGIPSLSSRSSFRFELVQWAVRLNAKEARQLARLPPQRRAESAPTRSKGNYGPFSQSERFQMSSLLASSNSVSFIFSHRRATIPCALFFPENSFCPLTGLIGNHSEVVGCFEYAGRRAWIGRSTFFHAPVRSHQKTNIPITTSAQRNSIIFLA
jgi:hypothetical protein